MITFSDIPYFRIDMNRFASWFGQVLSQLEKAHTFEEAYESILDIDTMMEKYETMAVICEIRNTMDVTDEFYRGEAVFFETAKTKYEGLLNRFYKAIVQSPHAKALEYYLGCDFFKKAHMKRQAFSPEAESLLQQENTLSARYSELTATLTAEWNGQKVPLSVLAQKAANGDLEVRRESNAILEKTWASIGAELDYIFDELVRVRAGTAKILCQKSYTDAAYLSRSRTSYTRQDVKSFREAVKEKIVPVVEDIYKQQKQESDRAIVYHYEEDYQAPENRITPYSDIVEGFGKIYQKISKETDIYYKAILEGGFYDLDIRPGKIMGAYANMVGRYHMPFIFETYNNTFGAVKTFAHETGHGFHSYVNRGEAFQFLQQCSSDLAEIHSMGMEFFIWPYLGDIIPPEQEKSYQYQHLKSALSFIPYGCAIDEFQEIVYDCPDMTMEERLEAWKSLERVYLPWRCYETNLFFAQGRFWQRQPHVYKWPFYYIDYVLAQICALQLHYLNRENPEKAWKCYLGILKDSAFCSFSETIQKEGLSTPFEGHTIAGLAAKIKEEMSLLEKETNR